MSVLAVTGGTGFLGGHLIEAALACGHDVRALTRRPRPPREGVIWIEGDLDRPGALAEGADALIHVAGAINAPDRAAFAAANVAGTEAVLAAASEAGVRRLVHVSSLAAREPHLSAYGWSKAESERVVVASGLSWTIVRPPAIYGPGDRELLELFRMAKRGVVPLPPGGRASLIHARDLAELLLALVPATETIGNTYEPDDGAPGGWDHRDLARAIGRAVGRRVLPLPIPRAAMLAAAWGDARLRGAKAKLTRDRVAYFCHPDWTSAPDAAPPPEVWRARLPTKTGLAETAAAYRASGWL